MSGVKYATEDLLVTLMSSVSRFISVLKDGKSIVAFVIA